MEMSPNPKPQSEPWSLYRFCHFGKAIGLLLFLAGLPVFGQPVFITLNLNEGNLSIKGSDRWLATLKNNENQRFACFLRATVKVQGEGQIANGVSKSFLLNPFETKVVSKQSTELFDSTRFEYQSYYRNAVIRTGELPSRQYEVCLQLLDRKTNQVLGETCINLEPQKFLPPTNIYPLSGDTLAEISNVSFQWTSIQPFKPGILYDIEITELFGNQQQLSTFFSNPLFHDKQNITSNSYVYPLSSRRFNSGKRYAWRVIGRLGDMRISSEPTAFFYQEKTGKPPGKQEEKGSFGVRSVLVLSTSSTIPEIPKADSLVFKIPKASKRYLSRLVITHGGGSSVVEKLITIEPGGSIISIDAKSLKPATIYRAMYTDINNQKQVIRFKII